MVLVGVFVCDIQKNVLAFSVYVCMRIWTRFVCKYERHCADARFISRVIICLYIRTRGFSHMSTCVMVSRHLYSILRRGKVLLGVCLKMFTIIIFV